MQWNELGIVFSAFCLLKGLCRLVRNLTCLFASNRRAGFDMLEEELACLSTSNLPRYAAIYRDQYCVSCSPQYVTPSHRVPKYSAYPTLPGYLLPRLSKILLDNRICLQLFPRAVFLFPHVVVSFFFCMELEAV